jgi:hypothetical protein
VGENLLANQMARDLGTGWNRNAPWSTPARTGQCRWTIDRLVWELEPLWVSVAKLEHQSQTSASDSSVALHVAVEFPDLDV